MQPTVNPLFDTKQFQDCLLNWSGSSVAYYDFLKDIWNTTVLGEVSWNQALHDGVFVSTAAKDVKEAGIIDTAKAGNALKSSIKEATFELTLFASTAIGNGQQANNPLVARIARSINKSFLGQFTLRYRQQMQPVLGFQIL